MFGKLNRQAIVFKSTLLYVEFENSQKWFVASVFYKNYLLFLLAVTSEQSPGSRMVQSGDVKASHAEEGHERILLSGLLFYDGPSCLVTCIRHDTI